MQTHFLVMPDEQPYERTTGPMGIPGVKRSELKNKIQKLKPVDTPKRQEKPGVKERNKEECGIVLNTKDRTKPDTVNGKQFEINKIWKNLRQCYNITNVDTNQSKR